jgi:transcriptional regulator with XRE-family HTH domain
LPRTEIGNAIRELREALGGISQERFARKLGTTTRTVSRWEAAEALSPRILSRLHAIASAVGAQETASFFDSKIRETLDWEPDITENQSTPGAPDKQAISTTPVERALVSLVLELYRSNHKSILPLLEQLLISKFAVLHLEGLQLGREKRSIVWSDLPERTPAEQLVKLIGPPLSTSGREASEIVKALLLKHPEIIRALRARRSSKEKAKQ